MSKLTAAIIEDEVPAARLLSSIITRLRPDWEVTVLPGSVEEAIVWFRTHFRSTLRFVIRHRYATVGLMVVLLVVSAWSFKFIPKVFVPALEKPYFTLDVWLPSSKNLYAAHAPRN